MSKLQGIESILPKSLDYKQMKKSMVRGTRKTMKLLPDSAPEYWAYDNNNKITFSIPEKYASQVKKNTTIAFKVSGSDQSYSAKVYAIEPEVEVATRTLKVRALANNSDGKLFPGTFADVELPLDIINDAVVIPTEAIIPVQNGKKVFIANKGMAKEVMVETATRSDASILILSGLKAGDTVLTSGVMSLKDESPIVVKIK